MWGLLISLLIVPSLLVGQITIGPNNSAGVSPGVVKFVDWYTATPGCTSTATQYCIGSNNPGGDTFYGQAWLANASQLPITSGLPIVGTLNDNSISCANNISVLQLAAFSWSALTSAYFQLVNCMNDYGPNTGQNSPAGWNSHCTGTDNVTVTGWDCSWKNGGSFSKGGVIYLPIHRQITTGLPSIHDGSIVQSPDGGQHWCNPYTLYNVGTSPGGCNSSKWSATGDAPTCGSSSNATPCTDASYLDATHSSMMWNGNLGTQMPYGSLSWIWVNYGNQDGSSYPTGLSNDGCNPGTYTCFIMSNEGSIMRCPNASIMDVNSCQYYTSPGANRSYRSSGGVASSWTNTFANRTPIVNLQSQFQAFSVLWVKELKCYLMIGATTASGASGGGGGSTSYMWAYNIQGPWTWFYVSPTTTPDNGFTALTPSVYYNPVSANELQIGVESDSYHTSTATPQFAVWDFAPGRSSFGGFSFTNRTFYVANAGYQFSDGHIPYSFPQKGLVWSFDYLDTGLNSTVTNYPYFIDSANNTNVMVPCDSGYAALTNCGTMIPGHGTSMNQYGINMNQAANQYGGHFQTLLSDINYTSQNVSAMQGNSSYTVAGVYRMEALTNFGRPGGLWSTGDPTSSADNPLVELNQINGTLQLDWGGTAASHYHYVGNVTLGLNNWYNVIVSVQAATGGNCPVASVWVGVGGTLVDALAGASCVAVGTPGAKTPNVVASPLVIGLNSYTAGVDLGEPFIGTTATTMVYSRAFSSVDAQFYYNSMKKKAKDRGITLQ